MLLLSRNILGHKTEKFKLLTLNKKTIRLSRATSPDQGSAPARAARFSARPGTVISKPGFQRLAIFSPEHGPGPESQDDLKNEKFLKKCEQKHFFKII